MKLLSVLLFFLAAGCANPDYINPDLKPVSNSQNEGDACALPLANSGLCASITWTTGPQSPAESEFILKLWKNTDNENGPFVDPENTLSVILWMPSMGHGSSPVTIEKIEPGVYRVRRVFFIMSGDWEVRLFIKEGSRVVDQATVSLLI